MANLTQPPAPLAYDDVCRAVKHSDWKIQLLDLNKGVRGATQPDEFAVLTRRLRRPTKGPEEPSRSGEMKTPDQTDSETSALSSGNTIRSKSSVGGENDRTGTVRSSSPGDDVLENIVPPRSGGQDGSGVDAVVGDQGCGLDGSDAGDDSGEFENLPTVQAMGTGRCGLTITYDTEFTTYDVGGGMKCRFIDSYQFCCIDPDDGDYMVQVSILPLNRQRIVLEEALFIVVREAGLWRTVEGMLERGHFKKHVHKRDGDGKLDYAKTFKAAFKRGALDITLIGHYSQADLTAFERPKKQRKGGDKFNDPVRHATNASGGLVTLKPWWVVRRDPRGDWWMPMRVTLRDTMGQAPPDKKSLEALGEVCGVEKIYVPEDVKSDMATMLRDDTLGFLKYGINDCVVVLEYVSKLWGDNAVPPVTLSGGGASAVRAGVAEYWGVGNEAELTARLQGLVKIDKTEVNDDDRYKLEYYVKRELRPVDGHAGLLIFGCAQGFHGGNNGCPRPGCYPGPTVDVDAQNAYPTAMAMVIDPDFEAGCIERTVEDHTFTEADFVRGYKTGLVAYCKWEFPESVAHPCLPVSHDGAIVYPRTSRGIGASLGTGMAGSGFEAAFEGAWMMGPEILLAVKLGARVECQVGYFTSVYRVNGEESMALRHALQMMVRDRAKAKKWYGKKSLQELMIKVATNSVYGKLAQDVSDRNAWNAWAQEMDNIGGSAITSSYHAAMTTSIVRAQLMAVANQLGDVYSITTDGFITGHSVDDVEALDLYGMAAELREAREFLTGDPEIWEAKHEQTDLLNLTTRGNVSLQEGGVIAKTSMKSPKTSSAAALKSGLGSTRLR